MQVMMQLQVNVLGEATWTNTALEGPGPRVQAQVGLEVAGVAEAFVAHQALIGPLPSMHQVVLLQVGELSEALLAQGTLEWALPTVHTQMDLEVGKLPKVLAAHVALVQGFSVLLLQQVRQRCGARPGACWGPPGCSHPASALWPWGVGPGSSRISIPSLGRLDLATGRGGPWVRIRDVPLGSGVPGFIDFHQQTGHSHGGVGGA